MATRLRFEPLETRENPAALAWATESFNTPTVQAPADWGSWPTQGTFAVVAGIGTGNSGALQGNRWGRAWHPTAVPADFIVRAAVRTDSQSPVEFFQRGQNLDQERASYYGVHLSPNGELAFRRVQDGHVTTLASVQPRTVVTGAKWLTITLKANGPMFSVIVQRMDTRAYLAANGQWSARVTTAFHVRDTALTAGGHAGVAHPTADNGTIAVDQFTLIAPNGPRVQTFDQRFSKVPTNWTAWSSDGTADLSNRAKGTSGTGLALAGTSTEAARLWLNTPMPADVQVRANVLADTLVPVQLLARGSQLHTPTPSYYAVQIVRGTTVKLLRVQNGTTVELASLSTKNYLSGVWFDVALALQKDQLHVRVQRRDTKEWLTATGVWQTTPTAALNVRDGALPTAGYVGLGRPASYAGAVQVDHFRVLPPPPDITPPTVSAQIVPLATPLAQGAFSGFTRFAVQVQDASATTHVEFVLDGELVARSLKAPYQHDFETRNVANGTHTLLVRAWDAAGNVGTSQQTFQTVNPASFTLPTIPKHHDHIRYASLAYHGTPMGPTEQALLRDHVDLVIPNTKYLGTINNTSPNTPQLLYSNLSNLYLELLTDWLAFADRTGRSREEAFYHVAKATPFKGDSPSSQPVNWLWNVQRGSATGAFKTLTTEARNSTATDVGFGEAGEALYLGYPEPYREVNVALARGASAGWQSVVEYPTASDANGRPTAWQTLTLLSDSTQAWRRSGTVTFDPPVNWVPTVVSGSTAKLYYLRVRTVAGTSEQAPQATRIVGRDYVQAKGTTAGTIPAFDERADTNGDGYLNNAEYAKRRAGFTARFAYEGRLFYPYYGQMRFVTNPSGAGVAAWAGDYHARFLAQQPLADGVFLDNSGGKMPAPTTLVHETTATYATDYAAMLGAINRAIAPRWVMANTAGGGEAADRVTRQVPSILEEFALRPLANTHAQFRDNAAMVARRLAVSSPSSYIVLDSLSQGGSPTDPRTRIAALAYYYMLADPDSTMFMTWGGEEPASAWERHWFDAIAYNVGRPQATWSVFAQGTDPANASLKYEVYQRPYANALVLYKPLSHTTGQPPGTTGSNTATTHTLNGNYRPLNADGTLGAIVNRVTLRNGEGAILVRA